MKNKEQIKRILFLILLLPSFFILHGKDKNTAFTVIMGGLTTSEGSVMVAHNENWNGKSYFVNVHKLQEAEGKRSIGSLWLQIPGVQIADSYMNERGVVITSNECNSREDNPRLKAGGIGYKLRRDIAEQAISARHGIEIAGRLIDKYGFVDSGRSFAIADAHEAWLLHVVRGKHWIAKRIPPGHIAVIANRYTIGTIDLTDTSNYMGSSDLIKYAVKRGWFKPGNTGKFNFADVYSKPGSLKQDDNRLRQWRGTSLLAKKKFSLDEPLPCTFEAGKGLKITDVFRLLRDHYEGTDYDLTRGYKDGSPNRTSRLTICTESTCYSFVAQVRKNMPPEIANIAWLAFSQPDTNAYAPWYFSITAPPDGYTRGDSEIALEYHFKQSIPVFRFHPKYAYWTFDKLSKLVDQNYRPRVRITRKEWNNFENYALKILKKKEKEFFYVLKKNKLLALKLLTNHVGYLEYRKWFLATELIEQLK